VSPYRENQAVFVETDIADDEAHRRDAEQIRRAEPDAVHVLIEGNSAFAASIANPDKLFKEVEHRWLETEQRIDGDTPSQARQPLQGGRHQAHAAVKLTYTERLLELLSSHNRVAVVKDEAVVTDGRAAPEILSLATSETSNPAPANHVIATAIAHRAPAGDWLSPTSWGNSSVREGRYTPHRHTSQPLSVIR
jgi:hypothetical protein